MGVAVQDSDPRQIIEDALRQFGMTVDHVKVSASRAWVKLAREPGGGRISRQHIALTARVLGMDIEVEQTQND